MTNDMPGITKKQDAMNIRDRSIGGMHASQDDHLGVSETIGSEEPTFTLRGQDITAPSVVLEWIRHNFESAPEEKIRAAFEHALLMRKWPSRRKPD